MTLATLLTDHRADDRQERDSAVSIRGSGSGETDRVAQAHQRHQMAHCEAATDASARRAVRDDGGVSCTWGTEYDWRKVEARMSSYPSVPHDRDRRALHPLHPRSFETPECLADSS